MARQLTLEIAVEKARAQEDLRQLEQGLKNLEQAALKTGSATDKQSAAYDNLSKRANEARDRIKGLGGEQEKSNKLTDMATSAILKYVSAGAVIAAIKFTADWADRLEELSKSTGLSITMLQKLDQVTKLNGSSIETLSRAFATMQDRVAGGDKSAVRAFDRLGLSFEAFQRMRPDDQMENLAIAVMRIEDPMERANVVTDLFGKTGVQLISTLEAIANGMDGIAVASEENIKAIAQLSDGWEAAKGAMARILVEGYGPMIRQAQLANDKRAEEIDQWRAWTVQMSTAVLPGLQGFIDKQLQLAEIMGGRGPGLPKIPGEPDYGQGGTGGMLPTWEEMLRIQKETAGISEQINQRKREQIKAEKEIEESLKQQAFFGDKILGSAAAVLGIKVKNFAWEDYNPQPGAPGVPGGGANNYAAILASLFGMNGPGAPESPSNPSYWRRYGQQLGTMQSDWRAQNFGSAEGWMNSAVGWGQALQDVSEHGDPVWNATNVRGRGKRAAAGALKGAEVGGRFGGPYGAMGGAAIGALIGAFRNPMFEDIFNRVAKNFGSAISEELAKNIEKRAKTEFRGDRQAAEVRSLGQILGETGLNGDNITLMTARLHDAFALFNGGKFDKKQLQATLDESFGYFAQYYDKIGGLADKSFTEIIRLARESGVESAAVSEYVQAQVTKAAAGIEQYLDNATVKSQSAASGLAASMVLLFDEMRKGPEGIRGAIDALGPSILALQEQMKKAGFEGTDAFNGMLSYVEAFNVKGVAEATEAVDGLTMTLEGLHNSTLLNAEAFSGLARAMTDEIEVARQALIAQGKDGDNALRLNAKGLQTVWELQKQFGWAVDESTQAMLDQAEAQGLIGKEFMDTNERMVDALERLNTTLDRIAEGFGFVGDAAVSAGEVIDREMGRTRTVPVEIEYPDGYTPGSYGRENAEGFAGGGVVGRRSLRYLAGGWIPRGTDTVPAMLTPGEGVLSLRGMRALGRLNAGDVGGSGDTYQITVNANSASEGRAAARELETWMRRRGVKLKGVPA